MNYLEKCLFNLDAVSKIPTGVRVNTRGDTISAEKDSYVQWLWRLSDSREKAFRTIKFQINTVIELSTRIMESKYLTARSETIEYYERVNEIKKICRGLIFAKRGVENLRETYSDDNDAAAMSCDITIEIDKHVSAIKIFLRGLGEDAIE